MEETPKGYLLIHNIQKNKNIGMLIRSAAANNINNVFTVIKDEEKKKVKMSKIEKTFQLFGNHGTAKQMEYENFSSLADAKTYFNENKIKVCGI